MYFIPQQKGWGGALKGAMSGASAGLALGPWGLLGAVPGAILGTVTEDIEDKKRREAEALMASYGNVPMAEYGMYLNGGNLPYNAENGEVVEQGNAPAPQVVGENGNAEQIAPGAVKVEGPQHEQGGVDMQGGEYVFSDTLKTKNGKTFAEEAEKLYKELGNITKLYGKHNDRFMRGMYKRMNDRIESKLTMLRADQEATRGSMPVGKGGGKTKWIQKATASIKRRGTAGKCTPISKPGCTGRARALALTFKKIARNREFGGPTPEKAREILRDGTIHGNPITEKQRGFFGLIAGGGKPSKEHGGDVNDMVKMMRSMGSKMMKFGGGLSRKEDYGSRSKPYPSVKSSDFAGGNRSYPIPTKADAIDALRLAGLHGRGDVRSRVFAKYPQLRKKQEGGFTGWDAVGYGLQAIGPAFDIAQSFKKAEIPSDVSDAYDRIPFFPIDFSKEVQQATEEIDRGTASATNAARDNATSAQEYLSAVRSITNDANIKKSRLIAEATEKAANVNAQMRTDVASRNAQIAMAEEQARSQASAAKTKAGEQGLYGLGMIGASYIRDKNMMKMYDKYFGNRDINTYAEMANVASRTPGIMRRRNYNAGNFGEGNAISEKLTGVPPMDMGDIPPYHTGEGEGPINRNTPIMTEPEQKPYSMRDSEGYPQSRKQSDIEFMMQYGIYNPEQFNKYMLRERATSAGLRDPYDLSW